MDWELKIKDYKSEIFGSLIRDHNFEIQYHRLGSEKTDYKYV